MTPNEYRQRGIQEFQLTILVILCLIMVVQGLPWWAPLTLFVGGFAILVYYWREGGKGVHRKRR